LNKKIGWSGGVPTRFSPERNRWLSCFQPKIFDETSYLNHSNNLLKIVFFLKKNWALIKILKPLYGIQ